jgi:hypothetical protein
MNPIFAVASDEPTPKTYATIHVLKRNSPRQRRRQVAAIGESQLATRRFRLKAGWQMMV